MHEDSTIFDSSSDPAASESGYTVELTYASDGSISSVQVIDHEVGGIVEFPPDVAVLIAAAITAQVRLPRTSLH